MSLASAKEISGLMARVVQMIRDNPEETRFVMFLEDCEGVIEKRPLESGEFLEETFEEPLALPTNPCATDLGRCSFPKITYRRIAEGFSEGVCVTAYYEEICRG